MTVDERVAKARQFLADAEGEFAAGDHVQASEKMWGAAAHAIMAVAQQRGWRYGGHRRMIEAAQRVASEMGDRELHSGLDAARRLHSNFYHDFIKGAELETMTAAARRFVQKMPALVE